MPMMSLEKWKGIKWLKLKQKSDFWMSDKLCYTNAFEFEYVTIFIVEIFKTANKIKNTWFPDFFVDKLAQNLLISDGFSWKSSNEEMLCLLLYMKNPSL